MLTVMFLGGSLIIGTMLLPVVLDILLLVLIIKGITRLFRRRDRDRRY